MCLFKLLIPNVGTTYKQKKGKEVIVQLAFETDVYDEIVKSRRNTQV